MWLKNQQLCYTFLDKSFGSSKNSVIFVSTFKTKVMKGSVYKAKEKMKWVWFIPIIIAFTTHFVLKHETEKTSDYWFLFIMIGVMWNFILTGYVIGQIWKKIKVRLIVIMIKKTMFYHKKALHALVNKDFPTVKIILDKCLPRYDPSSIMTHFIFGAYSMGSEDIVGISKLIKEIEKSEL